MGRRFGECCRFRRRKSDVYLCCDFWLQGRRLCLWGLLMKLHFFVFLLVGHSGFIDALSNQPATVQDISLAPPKYLKLAFRSQQIASSIQICQQRLCCSDFLYQIPPTSRFSPPEINENYRRNFSHPLPSLKERKGRVASQVAFGLTREPSPASPSHYKRYRAAGCSSRVWP